MISIARFILCIALLSIALNGCVASKQNKLGTVGNNNLPYLDSIKMLQPEQFIQKGINIQYILSPQRMLGLTTEDIKQMFGVPNFVHYDPPAEIWQYREDSCLLDFFLYADKKQPKILRVKHVEARGRTIYKMSQIKCFLGVLRTRP